jgi:uncharacterized cupin superfamily protein
VSAKPTLPAFDPADVPARATTGYPAPFRDAVAGRQKQALGDFAGLRNFGVNRVRLQPGAASSQRHWHTRQDELVYVLEGEVTLVTDAGEQVLRPGMAAGFPAGKQDGHQLINRSPADVVYLEIGDRLPGDEADYPDIDMKLRLVDGKPAFLHKDGRPY